MLCVSVYQCRLSCVRRRHYCSRAAVGSGLAANENVEEIALPCEMMTLPWVLLRVSTGVRSWQVQECWLLNIVKE